MNAVDALWALSDAVRLLTEAASGVRHDDSWIRPMRLSMRDRVLCARAALDTLLYLNEHL